jgi:hypothetical protein
LTESAASCCDREARAGSLIIESMRAARLDYRPLVALLLVCAAGCAKRPVASTPSAGRVTVGVTSRGPGVESLTFAVSIEPAGIDGSVKGDVGVFTAENTPAGSHVVRLRNLPGRCRIEGEPERRITVGAGRSTTVQFVVLCS